MPIETFIFLGLLVILGIAGWGADKRWRAKNLPKWHERDGIKPMSKEDERVNATLAARRAAKK